MTVIQLFIFLFLISCKVIVPKSDNYLSQVSNNFGDNDRHIWKKYTNFPNPLNLIGTLKHPNGSRCTASYIGKKFVITAAHCVMKKNTHFLQKGNYTFEHIHLPNNKIKETRKILRFYYRELVHLGGFRSAKYHWVILELDEPIKVNKDSFLGIKYPGDEHYNIHHKSNVKLSLAGHSPYYNNDTLLLSYSDGKCKFKEFKANKHVALHDCDAGHRDSGSPIYKCNGKRGKWTNCYISGLHVGALNEGEDGSPLNIEQYNSQYANIAVTSKSFARTVFYLMTGKQRPKYLKIKDN